MLTKKPNCCIVLCKVIIIFFIQETRARSGKYLPCYKKSSGKILEILKLYSYHWVAVTNFYLDLSDKPDQKQNQEIVYNLDPYLKASHHHKSNGVKYPVSLGQDVCDILPLLNEKIRFIVMNIDQAPKSMLGTTPFYFATSF